jgi:hypothetical protein
MSDPAWRHAAVSRRPLVITIARLARGHGQRIGWGQDDVGVAHGRGHPGAPRAPRLGQLIEVGLAVEGTSGHQGGGSIRGLSLIEIGMHHLAQRVWSTASAAERLHESRTARVGLDDPCPPDVVEVRAMLSTRARGPVNDVCSGWLVAVIAPIDMNARAVEGQRKWTQAPTLGGRRRDETREGCHPIVIQGIHGATERIIVELVGGHAGRDASVGGLMRAEAGAQVARLMDTPQAIQHHRVDRFPHREVPPCGVLWGGLGNHVAKAQGIAHASHKAAMIQTLATVRRLVGPHHLLGW